MEDSVVMYPINSDTLETLIDTVHQLHNQTTRNEKLFAGKIDDWYHWYLSEKGGHYAITHYYSLPLQEKNMSKCMKDLSIN